MFPIDSNNSDIITCFADDNANNGIINPRNPYTNEFLSVEKLIKSGHILVADMLKALEDDNYYKNHFQKLLNLDE